MNKNKGFTLIELLVVIAIIGILASLVLVALGNARQKANDARVKSGIAQLRTLAEQIYDNGGSSYATVETCFTTTQDATNCKGAEASVTTLLADIDASNGANGAVTSESIAGAYCVQAPLASTTERFCADSSGIAKVVNGACVALTGLCP